MFDRLTAAILSLNALCCVLFMTLPSCQGGINWQLPAGPSVWAPHFRTQQLMVMGVDVSHGVTSKSSPSVAAVVASQDPACTRYTAAVMEQTAGHEVVLGMQEATGQLLRGYVSQRGQPPESVLVFRDGVSDSMYGAVLQHEVAAIRAACEEVASCKPKVLRHGVLGVWLTDSAWLVLFPQTKECRQVYCGLMQAYMSPAELCLCCCSLCTAARRSPMWLCLETMAPASSPPLIACAAMSSQALLLTPSWWPPSSMSSS